MPELILASTSRYKSALLKQLQIPFRCVDPAVDERTLPAETASETAARLAALKSGAVFARFPQSLVLGADQTAEREGTLLRKPGNRERAATQLRECSGRSVRFHSAIALHAPGLAQPLIRISSIDVRYRHLQQWQIDDYLDRERPFDCLGSFKCEGLGIRLLEQVRSDDPTALVGLPLIDVCSLLAEVGFTDRQ